jgi:tetratricopeptide (TPR) repeat protein
MNDASRPRLARLLVCAGASGVLAWGAYSAAVRAYADYLGRQTNLSACSRALRLAPGNAAYWLRRANLLDDAGLSGADALERAAKLDPYNATFWLRLGLDAEARNDNTRAERCFLEAARVSRLFQPRWTLANFYLRRGNSAAFWNWTRSALELAPADPTALFQLCWRVSQDAGEILRNAIPEVREVRRDYAAFLISRNRLAAAASLLPAFADAGPEDRTMLLDACDRFLANGMAEPAMSAWNALCSHGLLPFDALQPAAGVSLTNGSFRAGGIGRGFDWRWSPVEGVTATIGAGMAAVNFSGKQAESAETIWQLVPVAPGRTYSLRFEYQTTDIASPSGVRWQVAGIDGAGELGTSTDLAAPSWKAEAFRFRVPPGVDLVRLRLLYARAAGTVRIDGSVVTRAMRLEME